MGSVASIFAVTGPSSGRSAQSASAAAAGHASAVPKLRYAPPPPLTKWCAVRRPAGALGVVLEVVRVARHDDRDAVFAQQCAAARANPRSSPTCVVAARVERVAEDGHRRTCRERGRARRRSHASCAGSTVLATPVSTAMSANRSVCTSKNGARWKPVGTGTRAQARGLRDERLDPASVVLVSPLSASTRARIAARAASGVRNVALKASSASYQSWLPGIA